MSFIKKSLNFFCDAKFKQFFHGDIKPQNLVINEETKQIKVLDFDCSFRGKHKNKSNDPFATNIINFTGKSFGYYAP